jgi:hypothetical protein
VFLTYNLLTGIVSVPGFEDAVASYFMSLRLTSMEESRSFDGRIFF